MKRDKNIDNLRGLAMIAMIIIHATAYFLKDPLAFRIWDFLEWAVPVFLFCSFYLFYDKLKKFDFSQFPSYLKKRLSRLIFPYWTFLLFFLPPLFYFSPNKFNWNSISSNIFLYGGIDFNWLVLLFVYFTFLMPLIFFLENKKIIYYSLLTISVASSIIFIFYSPFDYRADMWISWLVFVYFTIFFLKNKHNKKNMTSLIVISFAAYLGTYFLEAKIGHNLTHYGNKYPPTLLHNSYGILSIIVLYYLSKKGIFSFLKFDRILKFFSINSYSIFFIHILVIYAFGWAHIYFSDWVSFFGAITVVSILVQLFINNIRKLLLFKPVKV